MGDIIELAEYDDNGSALEIRFDQAVMDTFEVSKSLWTDIINYRGKTQGYNALETADGVRVRVPEHLVDAASAYLMLMKERLDKLQIHGLVMWARAFADKRRHPTEMGGASRSNRSWPSDPAAGKPNEMMLDADEAIGEYIEWELTQTNNPFYILQEYGLEAALACIKELFWEQMNGNKELGVKGLGEFDFRYIDAMVDLMGETGYLLGQGKTGNMVDAVPSLIGGIGGEDPGRLCGTASADGYQGQARGYGRGRAAGATSKSALSWPRSPQASSADGSDSTA